MKKISIQIPVKFKPSERIHNKNFIQLGKKPFFAWLLDRLVDAPKEWDIYIDSESKEVFDTISKRYENNNRFLFHERSPEYAENWANGNHLINQFAINHPNYDIYCQLFLTAVNLELSTIENCINNFKNQNKYDSSFLVTKKTGWVWYKGKSINYDHKVMNGLPRSQDANFYQETTGMYTIKKDVLLQTGCRIGKNPILYEINEKESFDIDEKQDIENFLKNYEC